MCCETGSFFSTTMSCHIQLNELYLISFLIGKSDFRILYVIEVYIPIMYTTDPTQYYGLTYNKEMEFHVYKTYYKKTNDLYYINSCLWVICNDKFYKHHTKTLKEHSMFHSTHWIKLWRCKMSMVWMEFFLTSNKVAWKYHALMLFKRRETTLWIILHLFNVVW